MQVKLLYDDGYQYGKIVHLCEECYLRNKGAKRIGPSEPNSTCKNCGAMLGVRTKE